MHFSERILNIKWRMIVSVMIIYAVQSTDFKIPLLMLQQFMH